MKMIGIERWDLGRVPAGRALGVAGLLLAACLLALLGASTAQAAGKSTQTEAIWVKFDPDAETVTAKVKKPGKGPDAKKMKRGKETVFKVKKDGSVLTRTTVAINGKKGELDEIPAGKTVFIYWRPDETDKTAHFARKIDVIFSEEELEERYKPVDVD